MAVFYEDAGYVAWRDGFAVVVFSVFGIRFSYYSFAFFLVLM